MSEIKKLNPERVWKHFYSLTQIPRPSKKEAKVIEFMKNFGKNLGLETIVDDIGNVIIRKPATPGMENRKGIIFQGHLDMVPQKNSDKTHDFEKDPIETIIDGEWVKANGTTLGADNGMGCAAAMAVLEAKDLVHGPIEALFTIDEETGMTGANELKPGFLKGDILMNLDSEDEGELYVGCAGGVDVNVFMNYPQEDLHKGFVAYKLSVTGLKGGHSGMDINIGRANSNKILFRFLTHSIHFFNLKIVEIIGGSLRNAIPRESFAIVAIPENEAKKFEEEVVKFEKIFKSEFAKTEPGMQMKLQKTDSPAKVMAQDEMNKICKAVYVCPHGVERMSDDMPGLVETSNNLAIVKCVNGEFVVNCLVRSSVDSAKIGVMHKIGVLFNLINADVSFDGAYPGWKPNMESPILKTMIKTYEGLYAKTPEIKAIHAGLECGILGAVYPNWDMISFGPTIRYPHSPDEKIFIPSVEKFWNYIVETMKNVPVK